MKEVQDSKNEYVSLCKRYADLQIGFAIRTKSEAQYDDMTTNLLKFMEQIHKAYALVIKSLHDNTVDRKAVFDKYIAICRGFNQMLDDMQTMIWSKK
ncbi:MAG: hypothetical protein OXC46_08010 [Thaumarchaeota archaeon]|nr:hypothetical protein [Nitrososphaerota archaeon]